MSVNSETDTTCSFAVHGNNILELCIAKYWSNYGTTHLKYSLEFHGIQATNSTQMLAAEGIHSMSVTALGIEDIQPQIQLKHATVSLKPTESKITPLSATRDVIPEGRQIYQNVITYAFNVPKAAEVSLYAPLLNSMLYESEFESQLWMLFDCNKMMVVCGDAHSNKFFTKLEKGDYTVKLQVRHEKRDLLEKLNEATMLANYKLANTLSLDVYDHYNHCITAGRKFLSCTLKEGQPKVLYVAPLAQEKLTKAGLPPACGWLSGTLLFAKDEVGRRVTDGCEFKYVLSPSESPKKNGNAAAGNGKDGAAKEKDAANATGQSAKTSDSNANQKTKVSAAAAAAGGDGQSPVTTPTGGSNSTLSTSPKKSKLSGDEYAEGLRDFQCTMIPKCDTDKAESIYSEVISANPSHLPAHILLMQNYETNVLKTQYPLSFVKTLETTDNTNEDDKKDKDEKMRNALQRVIELSDNVSNDVNKSSLLAYCGMKLDTRPDAAKIKTNMEKQKTYLIDALVKKGIAVVKLTLLNNEDKEKCWQELDSIYADALQLMDPLDAKVIQLSLWHAFAHNHYGRMYKALQKLYEEKRTRECFEELLLITETLDYQHLQTVVKRLSISAFPSGYRPF